MESLGRRRGKVGDMEAERRGELQEEWQGYNGAAGDSFTLDCGRVLTMNLSSVWLLSECVCACTCVCVTASDRCSILNTAT